MSDVDPTPDTPTTIGDRLGWFRGDLAERLALQLAALQALRGVEPAGDLGQVVQAVAALQGVQPATLRELATAVSALNATLSDLRGLGAFNTIGGIGGLLSSFRGEYLTENGYIKDAVLGIYASTGIPTGDATTTVLGRLAAIERLLATQVSGLPPVIDNDAIGSTTTTAVSGRKYAVFTPPIAGVAISENGINLTAVNGWGGYYAYVQTNGPAAYLNETIDIVNEWIQLVGSGSYNFAVDQQYSIRVYLRRPTFTGEQLTAVATVWSGLSGEQIPGYAIAWPALYAPNNTAPDGYFTPNRAIYATSNIAGRTIQLISGQCTVNRWIGPTPVQNNLTSTGDKFTIPADFTGRVSVQGATNSSFTIGLSA